MAEQPPDHPLARLILDYVRTLLWPALIVWAFLSFQDDLLEILKTREVEVAGAFKIGQRVEDLARNTRAELADLERMVSELQAAPADPERVQAVSEALAASLEALERNVTREAAELRGAAAAPDPEARPEAAPAAADPRAQARAQEAVGFERLLERDLESARAAFDEAARLWPTYHNVAEITRLLRRSGPDLAARGADGWAELYRTILTRYSWGMPAEVREAMQRAAGGRY
jgi:hypothetical protein